MHLLTIPRIKASLYRLIPPHMKTFCGGFEVDLIVDKA